LGVPREKNVGKPEFKILRIIQRILVTNSGASGNNVNKLVKRHAPSNGFYLFI